MLSPSPHGLPRRCDDLGQCVGTPKQCAAGTSCRQPGTCNPVDGQCISGVPKDEGQACNPNGDKCIRGAMCTAGQCVGTSKTCPVEQCRTQACDPQSGQCKATQKANGAACDDGEEAASCWAVEH